MFAFFLLETILFQFLRSLVFFPCGFLNDDSTVVLSPQVVNSMVRGGHELTAVQVYEGFKRVSISVGRNGVPALHIFPFCLDGRVSTPLLYYDVNLRHVTGILKYILFSGR